MAVRTSLVGRIIATEIISLEEIFCKKGRIYTFVNPVSYLTALKNKPLFMSFDGIFSDGIILVLAVLLLYHNRVSRRSFDMTSLAPRLFSYADRKEKSICIIASKTEQVELAIKLFSKDYPHIKWIGCRNGYFSSKEDINNEVLHVVGLNPDYLIIGMGSVKQEEFLLLCQQNGYQGIGFTCGGFIHQVATMNHSYYYPQWIDKLNIRWIYRFIREKHTRKRYIIAAFVFPVKFFIERVKDFFCVSEYKLMK